MSVGALMNRQQLVPRPTASEVVRWIAELYKIDDDGRGRSSNERRATHQEGIIGHCLKQTQRDCQIFSLVRVHKRQAADIIE